MPRSDEVVSLLSELVGFRTDLAGDERSLAEHLAARLRRHAPDELVIADALRASGPVSSYVYARFGTPRVLINAHLDTVPPNADWTSDPFTARVEDGRIYALGACDTKGAIAAILAALDDVTPKDVAILFSGDEESTSAAMKAFVASRPSLPPRAIVCEPTNLRAGVRHRGYLGLEASMSGPGGHSSKADVLPAPVATLARVGVALDDWGRARRGEGPAGFEGMCVNVALIEGGVAHNVIPAHARLAASVRPPPGADTAAVAKALEEAARAVAPEAPLRVVRDNAPFATRDLAAFEAFVGEVATAPVDLAFWTEAAILSAHGVDAIVLGPGNIAQAHAPDEWVAIDELTLARSLFRHVLSGD